MEYFKYLRQYVGHKPIILPGSVVIILDEYNKMLLQKRRDGTWGLPGGLMDLGESFEEVAKREVLEETGLHIENLRLVDVFSGSDSYLKVPNGDELYSATAVYYTTDVRGTLDVDYRESEDMRYFAIDNLPVGLNELDRKYIDRFMEVVS
ncbi:NUDIX hydrolase [Aquisalibacillus elongatus]|uniref:ADP-ribose pyrophosphatase YjhB (NUDIX family) n=1 Tax=Aquisalibacillus elongatus TaxID=485577 RepID=A0A3N5BEE1_9BACI|nr:NUDIX hydrolase [Aquisalibacillus elongatus]RPF55269.1 ADP-ribose pyrophosphatase YjhB (NUDIX family) [Aquisalibacillus elongatus]